MLITAPSLGGHLAVHINLEDDQPLERVRFALLACERRARQTFPEDVCLIDVRALMEIELNAEEIAKIGTSLSPPTPDVDKVVHALGRQFGIGSIIIIGHPMYRKARAPWNPE